MQPVISFILVLSLLVFVHELGHFLFAKRAGILVREFAIGFGPKIYSKIHGETMYSVRALPLGGFVRMAGEDAEIVEIKTGTLAFATHNKEGQINHLYLYEPDLQENLTVGRVVEADLEDKLYVVLEDQNGLETKHSLNPQAIIHYDKKNQVQIAPLDRQFGSKTVGQKALAIFAGPLFNIVLTIILFSVYVFVSGVERLPIDKIVPGKPAAQAGMKSGDLITAINGEEIHTLDALRYKLTAAQGAPVNLTVKRGEQTLQFTLKPQKTGEVYQIGAEFNAATMKREATLSEAVTEGFRQTLDWSTFILDGFAKLVTGQLSIKSLGGPVQMGEITGKAAEYGIVPLIKWTALLSLNLGIFNLLPIPALDGSRLVFIGLEAVRGRPINPNKESLVHFVGFALLMMLMLVVTFNDIKRVFFT
ncbi:RIP metalloprotease RseP [Paenactinomyces guangxiensis]|uniref:Zinc metalloprotease n=2 Tax=Paenactinomyces guangxiensis TaxID=1490290 RepID=A0A7W2AAU3_9BACL|nr:RIP metalloprotease RseP [Paenactinomyces guangxiensis]MBH8593385.1 RIP metalloprotease RseP [Paenactinomyces guangxiensis]